MVAKLNNPLIVIVGETASGKSGLAMKLARENNGEIIASDSRTIYKGMDIGTAKPTRKDTDEITHHCLDLVKPGERFTASMFKEEALKAIEDISSRGKLPIMVGGTGLYINGVIFDYEFAEDSTEEERKKYDALSMEELAKMVAEKGGVSVDVKNRRHLVRFLETGGTRTGDSTLRENTVVIGLRIPKNKLRDKIVRRVEQQFEEGLRKEVDDLVNKYGWGSEALTGIGYREFEQHYKDEVSMSKVKRQIVQSTLHYAKRQRTWFKRNPHIQWFGTFAGAARAAEQFIELQTKK